MKYRTLGRAGVQVSSLCLGTMSFGREADEETSAAMFHRCREVGINFFDTSNNYAAGRSEEILGKLIEGCRDEIVLTSKVGFPVGDDVNAQGLSRRHIMLSVETSLKRLKTDRLDLFFLHHYDPRTPVEESLRALSAPGENPLSGRQQLGRLADRQSMVNRCITRSQSGSLCTRGSVVCILPRWPWPGSCHTRPSRRRSSGRAMWSNWKHRWPRSMCQ